MTLPDDILYAVLSDNIVVDCGFGDADKVVSPLSRQTYSNNEYEFVLMTIENSPAEIGMSYFNNKFLFKENN
jgi:hypothetical protein